MNRNLITLVAIVLGILLVGGYLLYSSTPVVSSQGHASIKATPDVVTVNIYIETRNSTAQGAQQSNADIREATVDALVAAGITESDIKFTNFYAGPEYDWSSGAQRQKGFIARQELAVQVEDFSEVSRVVDATLSSGALVSYISQELSSDKQNEYKALAQKQASADARTKAEATAEGLGKSLGRLVSVDSSDFNYPGPVMYYARAEGSMSVSSDEVREAAVKISPQDIDVSANVRVQYKLSLF